MREQYSEQPSQRANAVIGSHRTRRDEHDRSQEGLRNISQSIGEPDARRILRECVHILDATAHQEQRETAAQRCTADEDRSNAKRTERNDHKGSSQTDATDHGPERIAAQAVEKQREYGAGGEDEVSHPTRLQAGDDTKCHELRRVDDCNPGIDPKDLIGKQKVRQWSEQYDAQLRCYDAWEHWHVEAARHDVTGESKTAEGNECREVQHQWTVEKHEGPISRVCPHIMRLQLRAYALQWVDIVEIEYAAEFQRRVNDRLRYFPIALGILSTGNGRGQNPLGGDQRNQPKARNDEFESLTRASGLRHIQH